MKSVRLELIVHFGRGNVGLGRVDGAWTKCGKCVKII